MTGAAGGDGTSQPWVRVALLHRPEPPLGGLVRPDLLSSPDRGLQGSVQLVCAPAGFGKSVFVSQWWEQLAMPTVWLTLDSSVDHSRWLLAYLVAAVRQQFPDALAGSLQMARAATLPSEEAIVVELSNELDELDEPIVVLLDDYHQLAEPRIHSFISNLVRHPPQKVHLVVISGRNPRLPSGRCALTGTSASCGWPNWPSPRASSPNSWVERSHKRWPAARLPPLGVHRRVAGRSSTGRPGVAHGW